MKLVTFLKSNKPVVGVLAGSSVIDVAESAERVGAGVDLSSMNAVIRGGDDALRVIQQIASQPLSIPTFE